MFNPGGGRGGGGSLLTLNSSTHRFTPYYVSPREKSPSVALMSCKENIGRTKPLSCRIEIIKLRTVGNYFENFLQ